MVRFDCNNHRAGAPERWLSPVDPKPESLPCFSCPQEVSRLSSRERRELNASMIRLRHERSEGPKLISRRLRKMDSGKKIFLEELERQIAARE